MTGPDPGGFDVWATLAAERAAGWGALRDAGPVVEMEADAADRVGVPGARLFAVARALDVRAVLRDPERFSSSRRSGSGALPVAWPFNAFPGLPMCPAGYDAPEHTRYREMLAPLFGMREVQELVPVFEGLASSLIGGVAGRGECDAVAEIVNPMRLGRFWCTAVCLLMTPTGWPSGWRPH